MAMAKARRVKDNVQGIAKKIADKYGARVTPINLKSESSIRRKLKNNDVKGINDIKDLVRTTIIADAKDHDAILKELGAHPTHIRTKHQSRKDYGGYEGNITNIRVKGVTGEIQVISPEMIYAKGPMHVAYKMLGKQKFLEIKNRTGLLSGQGHAFYEYLRTQKKGGEKHSKMADQKNYYKNF